jgi:hypothetical protein
MEQFLTEDGILPQAYLGARETEEVHRAPSSPQGLKAL